MKRSVLITVVILTVALHLPGAASLAQTSKVPITYQDDTDETIARRVQWIEAARKEKMLVWWGNLRPNMAREVISDFNKIYPFIHVNYSRQASEEKGAKLEAEFAAGRLEVDVMEGGSRSFYPRWREMGILRKFVHFVPMVEKMPANRVGSTGDTMMAGNNAIVPMYNTRYVSAAEAPKNWEDILDPKWKGHIGMTADTKNWAILALSENGWGVEKTEKYLKGIRAQKPIWASGHTAGHMLMIAGEFKIMLEDYLYHALDSMDRGAPVEWVRASPVAITGQGVTAMSNSPHMNAANLFLEWLFSPKGLQSYERVTMRGAIYKGAETRQANLLKDLTFCIRTEEIEKKMNESGLLERFAEVLGVKPAY